MVKLAFLLLFVSSFFVLANVARAADVSRYTYIYNVYDFLDFIENVNSGTNYHGEEVHLMRDIDFSINIGSLPPIGLNKENSFMGTFYGRRKVIKNLVISSSSEYIGLFGYAQGASFYDIKLDSTCSITSNNSNAFVGGIVGYCAATNKRKCDIGRCVSAASITFSGGEGSGNEIVGSIIGGCQGSRKKGCSIINTMSYGLVKHEGKSKISIMGGLCGSCEGENSENGNCLIYNSGTYSTLTHNGETRSSLIIGNILGVGVNTVVENSLGASTINVDQKDMIIGGVAGLLKASKVIKVFWGEIGGILSAYGSKDNRTLIDGTSKSPKILSKEVQSQLLIYKNDRIFDKLFLYLFPIFDTRIEKLDWLYIKMNGGSIYGITRDAMIILRAFVPEPQKNEYTFSKWCEDVSFGGSCYSSIYRMYNVPLYVKYEPVGSVTKA